jgi:hypothetical protein
LYSRIVDEEDFTAIGARFQLSADQARAIFHNALRRMRKAYADTCGG